MPIKLTEDEAAFLERVNGYCRDGLTQPQMAEKEGIAITVLRNKLIYCSFTIESQTTRTLVRARTGETFEELREQGGIITELVAAA